MNASAPNLARRLWAKVVSGGRSRDALAQIIHDWKRAARKTYPTAEGLPNRLLIVPADPWTIVGSRGDQAMIDAVIAHFRDRDPEIEVAVATDPQVGGPIVSASGWKPFEIWTNPTFVAQLSETLDLWRPTCVCVVGADVIDGADDAVAAAKMLITADLSSRRGIPTSILGFSWSTKASRHLQPIFARLDRAVRLNIRDSRSLERFGQFSRRPIVPVADVAFTLMPAEGSRTLTAARRWIAARKGDGRLLLGINLHPQLFGRERREQSADLVETVARSLLFLHGQRPVSFVLIAHDFRAGGADDICLSPLAARLSELADIDLLRLPGEPSAAELKAVVGELDGLLTSRMHLAIAGLGSGVPTLAISYRDKFEGLFDLFALPPWLVVSPQQAIQGDFLAGALQRFVESLDVFSPDIRARLPAVAEAARKNFDVFETRSR